MNKSRVFIVISIILFACKLSAENGMNSPYTRYGVGQLSDLGLGVNKAMGGIGIGLRSSNLINLQNPASYSSVDTLTFLMDLGLSLMNTNFEEAGMKVNAHNATFDYLAVQYRLTKGLGMTLGFMPFSNIGYNFSNTQTILNDEDGSITSTSQYYGDGGLRQIIGGLGWNALDNLSVGANFSFIYGEINHYVYNLYSESSVRTRTKQYGTEISTYKLDFGLQYTAPIGKSLLTVGATYALGHAIDDDVYTIDKLSNSGSSTSVGDTTYYTQSQFSLPQSFGIGFSFVLDKKWTFAADYSLQQWGSVSFFDQKGANRQKVSLGLEFQPREISRNLFLRSKYRAGFYASSPYYAIDQKKGPMEYGVSAGVAIPIINGWNSKSTLNISGQFVRTQPQIQRMITENYLRLNIGVTFNEAWFAKWKVE